MSCRVDQANGNPASSETFGSAAAAAAAEKLRGLGCKVYPPQKEQGPTNWNYLAGSLP